MDTPARLAVYKFGLTFLKSVQWLLTARSVCIVWKVSTGIGYINVLQVDTFEPP